MITQYKPHLNLGPGEHIKDELEWRNWTQEDLAEVMCKSPKFVNELVMNKQPITLDTAQLLGGIFGASPQFWINLDATYRLRLREAESEKKSTVAKANIYQHMPIRDLRSKGWLTYESEEELFEKVKRFWGISKLDFSFMDRAELPSYRKSEAFSQFNKYYALTWFRMAQLCGESYSAPMFEKRRLQALSRDISDYSCRIDGVKSFLAALNKTGVKFFVLPHLQKTYIDGAAFMHEKNPVIVYTGRYDRADNFWFTLAHEMAHVLLHIKGEKDFFIDDLSVNGTKQEKEANDLAAESLKSKEIARYFAAYGKYISQRRIEACAEQLGVCADVVVGALQHKGMLSTRNLNRLKQPVMEKIPKRYFPHT